MHRGDPPGLEIVPRSSIPPGQLLPPPCSPRHLLTSRLGRAHLTAAHVYHRFLARNLSLIPLDAVSPNLSALEKQVQSPLRPDGIHAAAADYLEITAVRGKRPGSGACAAHQRPPPGNNRQYNHTHILKRANTKQVFLSQYTTPGDDRNRRYAAQPALHLSEQCKTRENWS